MASAEPMPSDAGGPAKSRGCGQRHGRLCLLLSPAGVQLPLRASSAAELAAILLAEDLPVRARRLTRLLTSDAAFAAWAAPAETTLAAAAESLAVRLPLALSDALAAPTDDPDRQAMRIKAFARAEAEASLARRIARRRGQPHSQDAGWQTFIALGMEALAHTLRPADPSNSLPAIEGQDQRLSPSANGATTDDPADARFFQRALTRSLRSFQRRYSGLATQLAPIVNDAARLARWEAEFARAVEAAKLAALKEFAYGAGHEINNPLATIAGRAQTLLVDEADPERRRALAAIVSQAFRAHEMIADLMLFANPPAVQAVAFDLAALLDEVAASLADAARAQGTDLSVAVDPRPLEIAADRPQVASAVRALAVNALEAVRQGGRVELRGGETADVRSGRSGAAILVVDDGPGVDPAVRPHLFDPFFSGREAGRGLGFGLCKCWRIAQSHGGRIDVASGSGQGATFTLWLPVRPAG